MLWVLKPCTNGSGFRGVRRPDYLHFESRSDENGRQTGFLWWSGVGVNRFYCILRDLRESILGVTGYQSENVVLQLFIHRLIPLTTV
jgi:hypothetical protein